MSVALLAHKCELGNNLRWMVGYRVGAAIGHQASGLPPKKESISSVSTDSDLSFPPRGESSSESCLNFCPD